MKKTGTNSTQLHHSLFAPEIYYRCFTCSSNRLRFYSMLGMLIIGLTVTCYLLYGLQQGTKTGMKTFITSFNTNREIKNGSETLLLTVAGKKINDSDNKTVIPKDLLNYLVGSINNSLKYPGIDIYISYTTTLLGLQPLTNVEPIRNDFGPVINDVTSFLYPIQIEKCAGNNVEPKANKSVFIAVVSAPANFERRDNIRKTWFNHLKDTHYHRNLVHFVGFAFFLGKTPDTDIQYQIKQEANLNKDIIQVDMIDDYYKLDQKAAALFNWIYNNCSAIDFLLKVDDDIYLNIRNLATTVALQLSPLSNYIYGRGAYNLFTTRDGKWRVSPEVWPWINLPKYLYGPWVLYPGKTIKSMLAATQTTPFHRIDDLYLTGLCSSHANIELRRSESFYRYEFNRIPIPEACHIRESISWLTFSTQQKFAFHNVTEKFYHNESLCILPNQASAVNPDDVVPIAFTPWL